MSLKPVNNIISAPHGSNADLSFKWSTIIITHFEKSLNACFVYRKYLLTTERIINKPKKVWLNDSIKNAKHTLQIAILCTNRELMKSPRKETNICF